MNSRSDSTINKSVSGDLHPYLFLIGPYAISYMHAIFSRDGPAWVVKGQLHKLRPRFVCMLIPRQFKAIDCVILFSALFKLVN